MKMKKLCVLVCPMDWGLGHASRCVPVISAFLAAGCRVVVGVSGHGAELIRREFRMAGSPETAGQNSVAGQPDDVTWGDRLQIIPFPGFSVSYSRNFFFPGLLLRVPAFLRHVAREKRVLRRLVESFRPDLIVSDNRYGLVHQGVTSVIITHQLRPSMPLLLRPLEGLVSAVIRRWAGAFDECWIPDYADDPAAGRLTAGHEKLPAAFFTGWLSRFSPGSSSETYQYTGAGQYDGSGQPGASVNSSALRSGGRTRPDAATSALFRYRFMFLLSGPEPHRTILEDMVKAEISGLPERALLVRGLPGSFPEREIRGNLEIVSFIDSGGLQKAIGESEIIVCRGGYSSVMDLLVLGRSAVLIPTPGQTEQEYLGKWLASKGWFRVVRQQDFNIQKLIARQKDGFAEGFVQRPHMGFGARMAERHKPVIAHKALLEQRVTDVLRKASAASGSVKS
jgi:hypothetical protein